MSNVPPGQRRRARSSSPGTDLAQRDSRSGAGDRTPGSHRDPRRNLLREISDGMECCSSVPLCLCGELGAPYVGPASWIVRRREFDGCAIGAVGVEFLAWGLRHQLRVVEMTGDADAGIGRADLAQLRLDRVAWSKSHGTSRMEIASSRGGYWAWNITFQNNSFTFFFDKRIRNRHRRK